MAGFTGGFGCSCGVRVYSRRDDEARTMTYRHGEGEAHRVFDLDALIRWAHSDLSEPHPAVAWIQTIHEYEKRGT